MKYFDAHTHVHFAAFKDDYHEVIQRALDSDVWMILVGTQLDTSRRAVEVAHEFKEGVFAAIGLHPIHTDASYHDEKELGLPSEALAKEGQGSSSFTSRGEAFDYDAYKKLAKDPKVVAIGECGLDYYRLSEETKEKQMAAFSAQIELAHEVKKPLMIHCRSGVAERASPQNRAGRNAFPDLIAILKASAKGGSASGGNSPKLKADSPGVIHFFTGTKRDTEELMDLGFAFTFGGVVTFTRDYDEVVKAIPLDRILSETDAPYVAPAPYRGKRNEPAYVVEIVKKLAELKDVAPEEMRDAIFTNAKRIFGIS